MATALTNTLRVALVVALLGLGVLSLAAAVRAG